MSQYDYDVIVVGAGPGGSACATMCAKKGLNVASVERAAVPGQKIMSGSTLFLPVMRRIWPDVDDAPWLYNYPTIEGGDMGFMADDGWSFTLGVHFGADIIYDAPMVFRNETDQWMAEQAVKAGAHLLCECARDLIIEDDFIKGIIVDDGKKITAPLVCACDGFNSLMAKRSGLAPVRQDRGGRGIGEGITQAIKYCYYMGEEKVASLGTAEKWEDGHYHDYSSMPVWSGIGEGGAWTAHALAVPARGLITVAVYQHVSDLCKSKANIHQRMAWFLSIPQNAHRLEGEELTYFETHLLTWERAHAVSDKTYRNGFLLFGDAAGMINAFDGYGADAAMVCGIYAAELAEECKQKNDYSENVLSRFEDMWKNDFIGRNEELPFELGRFLFEKEPDAGEGLRDVIDACMRGKFAGDAYIDWFADPQCISGMLRIAPQLNRALPMLVPMLQNINALGTNLLGGLING